MKSSATIGLAGLILSTLAGAFLLTAISWIAKRTAGKTAQAEKSGQKRTVLPGPPYFTRIVDRKTVL